MSLGWPSDRALSLDLVAWISNVRATAMAAGYSHGYENMYNLAIEFAPNK